MKKILLVISIITFIFSLFPKVWAQTNQTLNSGTATAFVSFPKTGCVYNWTNSNADIGLPTTGMGDIPSFIAINNGTNPITATITATPEASCLPVTFTITVNPAPPAITASGVLAPLTTTYGTASMSTSFIAYGKGVQGNILITPPPGFEISTDDLSYSNTVTIKGENSNALLNFIKINPDIIRTSINGTNDYNYTAEVGYDISMLQITPVAANPKAVIKINGMAVNSGTISPTINLNAGPNIINIIVIAPDGVTTKTYAINVSRAASTDATLKNLTISEGTLGPVFASNVTDYIAKVGSTVNSIQLTPVSASANATIAVNGVITVSATTSAPVALYPGNNVIPVIVTARDGITIKNYTVTVIKALSNNADIAQLYLTPASTIIQTPGTNNYTTAVEPTLSSIRVTAVADDPSAVIRINGILLPSGTLYADIPLNNSGTTTITTVATAQDGKTIKTYNIVISKNLKITKLSLDPVSTLTFKPIAGSINYVTSVDAAVTSIKQTAVTNDPNAIIRVNGVIVPSGSASAAIPLNNAGITTITTLLTSADGSNSQKYTIVINKNGSSNTDFAQLSLTPPSKLTLAPVSGSINYTTSVSPSVTRVQQIGVLSDPQASMQVNGITVASGATSPPIPLNSSGTTTITTVVTAHDGISTQAYTIKIIKSGSASASLNQLALTPAATLIYSRVPESVNYITSVGSSVTSVQQTAIADDAGATIRVNGSLVLSGTASNPIALNSSGTTTITTIVTAQDGVTTQTYTIVISKNGSTNTTLNSLSIDPASTITPTPGTSNFTTSVSQATTSIKQTTVTNDPNAKISVNGILVSPGTPSPPIPLNSNGTTIIATVITAENGVTSKTYLTTVSKNGSSNAALSQLFLTPGAPLSYKAIAGITNYTVSVAPSVTSIQQTAITSDAGATIKVNGIMITSGEMCAPISLNSNGATVIITVVTAQDGVTTKTYTVTVTHGSNNELLAPLPVDHILNTIYLRLATKTPAGVYSGDILLSSSNTNDTKVSTPPGVVKPAPLSIMISDINKSYGTALFSGTDITQFTPKGLMNAETLDKVTMNYGSGASAAAVVGIYAGSAMPIAVKGSNGFLTSNYQITYSTKNIIVMAASLTITANEVIKNYGAVLTNIASSANYSITEGSLQNGNMISSVSIGYGLGAAATDNGGTYSKTVIPSAAIGTNGFLNSNYTITYVAANLTVLPIPLTITADNKVKDFGTDNPVFTVRYSGFFNNDTPSQLISMPVISTTAVIRSPLGTYPITISGAKSPNYVFKYVSGTLTISAEHVVLSIPNTITPNGDGINDIWNIKNLDAYPNATVDVFDRYGHKVFSAIGGYNIAWDGTYKGSPLPTGGYYYIINPKNNSKVMTGSVTVIR